MQEQEQQQEEEEEEESSFDCAIHFGRLRHPVPLPCSHEFCLRCLRRWRRHSADGELRCPLCRCEVPEGFELRAHALADADGGGGDFEDESEELDEDADGDDEEVQLQDEEEEDEEDAVLPWELAVMRLSGSYRTCRLRPAEGAEEVCATAEHLVTVRAGSLRLSAGESGQWQELRPRLRQRPVACRRVVEADDGRLVVAGVCDEVGVLLRLRPSDGQVEAFAETDGEFVDVHADVESGEVAAVRQRRVEFFDDRLRRTDFWLEFPNHLPERLVWHRAAGVLWLSCPTQRQLLIVKVPSGSIKQVSTEIAFGCELSRLLLTRPEGRLLATDERGRLYWLRSVAGNVCVHRPRLQPSLGAFDAVAAAADDRIICVSEGDLCRLELQTNRSRHACRVM